LAKLTRERKSPDWIEDIVIVDQNHADVTVRKLNGERVVFEVPRRPLLFRDDQDAFWGKEP
jgi:hypothetical protein